MRKKIMANLIISISILIISTFSGCLDSLTKAPTTLHINDSYSNTEIFIYSNELGYGLVERLTNFFR